MRALSSLLPIFLLLVAGAVCQNDKPRPDVLALRDSKMCASCHQDHYREWSGSMHAYASKDPVFLAMNARGQRETGGALGDFCVRCHAPMALVAGATTDGLNLEQVPDELQGVTCVFCHSTVGVAGAHNNPLVLVEDGVMRGAFADALPGAPHLTAYSPLHDRRRPESSALCGACHDVVLPGTGVHLERTFLEWRESLYAKEEYGALSCSACHMQGRQGVATSEPGAPERRVHSHAFPGVDVAITDFPERQEQRRLVERFLSTSLASELCVDEQGGLTELRVTLENVSAGHSFPSGAAHDRRVWVELRAFVGESEVFSSGVVGDDEPVAYLDDPNLWLLRERVFGEAGEEVHMFWEVHSIESELLPAPTAPMPTDPGYIDTHVTRTWLVPGLALDRVTLRVRMRPMGLELIDSLIASGDLDPALRGELPTFELGAAELEWHAADQVRCVPRAR
jgi:hypothetical protein